jgi:hypothetical protein
MNEVNLISWTMSNRLKLLTIIHGKLAFDDVGIHRVEAKAEPLLRLRRRWVAYELNH